MTQKRNQKQESVMSQKQNQESAMNDNDNGKKTVAPAPAGGALISLAALGAALNSVDLTPVRGRSGMPRLEFKAKEDTWQFGQRNIVPEADSCWAVNPTTFQWGRICFSDDNKCLGERLVPIDQPLPTVAECPDTGFEWKEQWAVNAKCLNGTDAGTEVVFKANTVGGIQAIAGILEAVRDRLNGGLHDGKLAPIVRLEKDSYQHPQYGRTSIPLCPITDWMPIVGPAPAPKPASPPPSSPTPAPAAPTTEQPRRRRIA
jgi:hypothetical protein